VRKTDSGLLPVADFGVNGVEFSASVTKEFVSYTRHTSLTHFYNSLCDIRPYTRN
jgi:hypothetical protein